MTEAEGGTSAEIVPVIATASGRYDRAEDVFGLLLGLLLLATGWLAFQGVRVTGAEWTQSPALIMRLPWVLASVVLGFIVGGFLATRFPALRLPFITKGEMRAEVERRSFEVFARRRVRKTAGATGILIYVSLYERMVRILPDDAIAGKIGDAEWAGVRDLIVAGMRAGQPAEGLRNAVTRCGELLREAFPVQPGDVNELPNQLVLLDE